MEKTENRATAGGLPRVVLRDGFDGRNALDALAALTISPSSLLSTLFQENYFWVFSIIYFLRLATQYTLPGRYGNLNHWMVRNFNASSWGGWKF